MCAMGTIAGEFHQNNKKLCVMTPRRRFSKEIKAKQIGGRSNDFSFSRSNGDWRCDKEDRLFLGWSGDNHVGTKKGERINSNAMMGDGREQAKVQGVGDSVGNMQTMHATVHIANNTNESKGKKEGTMEKGTDTCKKIQRTNKNNHSSSISVQVAGKKRGTEVDEMCIDEVIPSGKMSKGNGETGGGTVDVVANDAVESMEGKIGERDVRESAKNSIAGLSEQPYRSQ
jgi:hypothetical protein